jgi:putative flippase GtrA
MNKKEFILFVAAGGFAALVNFVSRIIFNFWFSFEVSVVLAYLIGMITAYILTKIFVFKAKSVGLVSSSIKFTIVNILAVLQTYFISVYLYYWLNNNINFDYNKEIAHFVGIAFPVITSYIGHKYYSFK